MPATRRPFNPSPFHPLHPHRCTPAKLGEHWPLFTHVFFLVQWLVFFFMAGQYPYFSAKTKADACTQKSADAKWWVFYGGMVATPLLSATHVG